MPWSAVVSTTTIPRSRLQHIQISLCRVVTHSSKLSNVSPLPSTENKLNWLPVTYRVQFKIGLLTYRIFKHGQPAYFRELKCSRSRPLTVELKNYTNIFPTPSVTMPQLSGMPFFSI